MITAGEVLKNKRESLGRTLDQVSSETKIQKRFLTYIEENKFSYFDSEVFLTGFIKIYAKYLGLDTNKILALYRRSNPSTKENSIPKRKQSGEEKNILKKKRIHLKILDPKSIATVILSLFLLSIVGYIAFQIYKFQTPPTITVFEPVDESEVVEENIAVKGKVDFDTVVEVNDKSVDVDQEGNFEIEIQLKEGSNIVTIRARKNRNNTLETVETIRVIYLIEEEILEEDQEQEVKNNLKLEIIDSPAWIRLDLDNENKLSQVVEPSELEYTFFDNMYIITGRVNNTNIYWNNEIVQWKPTQRTGVAELTCQIVEQELICE